MKPVFFARAAFSAAFLAGQLALILYAQKSPDHLFGFQMFNASSELKLTLYRQLHLYGQPYLVPLPGGVWQARDKRGVQHTFRWSDRVHDGVLGQLDRFVHASYGLDAQLFRLRYALDDVVAYSAEDASGEALIIDAETVNNGRERRTVRLIGERKP